MGFLARAARQIREGSRVKHVRFINVLLLALIVGFGLLIATADRYDFGFVDLQRPTTLLAFVADRLHTVSAAAGELVRDLVEWFAAPYREAIAAHAPGRARATIAAAAGSWPPEGSAWNTC